MKAHEIATKVAGLVGGDREHTHGSKLENFSKIATLWQAYLEIRRDPVRPLGPDDVGYMMALMKVARTQHGAYNPDDDLDLVGYGACVAEVSAALNAPSAPT